MAYRKSKKTKSRRPNGKWLVMLAVILALSAVAVVSWRLHSSSGNTTTTAKKTKPRPITDKTGGSSETSPPSPPTTDNPDNVPVAGPAGTFVSNHKPGQNGSPLEEASVCNTTPSASCTISFTKDGVTKSLPVKKTDDSGAAYWTWTPASVGLSAGSWTVHAVGTWGQQTATTEDPIKLEILP